MSDTRDTSNTAHAAAQPADEAAIQAALAAPYEVRLRQQGGKHVLSIPELGLVVSGKSLEAAHAELATQREKRIREFAAEGLLHWLERPAQAAQPAASGTFAKLRPFLIKCLVVSVLFLGAVHIIGQKLGDVGYVLEKKLQGLSNWTPEQVEWHRARSEQIAQKLGPTLRELQAMFRETTPGTGTGPAAPGQPEANATLGVSSSQPAPPANTTPATTPAPAKP